MIKDFIRKSYRNVVSIIKKLDKKTNYRIGNLVREKTNINTPQYWDKYLDKQGDFWRDFPYKFLLDELPGNSKFSLLDIGCALGDGCRLLKKHFPLADINGADLSELGINKAKMHGNDINYFCLDIFMQEPPQKYDYITLIHILEHFNDPYPIIDKCLKFTGRAVYISTPYGENFDDPRLYWKGEHRYLFNEKTFLAYNCEVLKITEWIEAVGTRYILYRITP